MGDDLHLCTDIIAGFPTETDSHWQRTVELVKKWKFTTMYISPFFPRPGTPAAGYDYVYGNPPNDRVDVDRIKKARVRELTELFASFEPHSKWLNTRQFWLCDRGLARDGIHFIGVNAFADKVFVRPPKEENSGDVMDLEGKILEVDVFECGKKYMYATVCEEYLQLLIEYPDEINYIALRDELWDRRTKKTSSTCGEWAQYFQHHLMFFGIVAPMMALVVWVLPGVVFIE